MAQSEASQTAIMQRAILAATAAVMVLKEADPGATSGNSTANMAEAHRPGYGSPRQVSRTVLFQNGSNQYTTD